MNLIPQKEHNLYEKIAITFLLVLLMIVYLIVCLNTQSSSSMQYKVPFVPFVPTLSIIFNIALMVNLQSLTWIRLVVWLTIGFIIYFSYGIKHSKLDPNRAGINNLNARNWGSTDDNACLADNASITSNY